MKKTQKKGPGQSKGVLSKLNENPDQNEKEVVGKKKEINPTGKDQPDKKK